MWRFMVDLVIVHLIGDPLDTGQKPSLISAAKVFI